MAARTARIAICLLLAAFGTTLNAQSPTPSGARRAGSPSRIVSLVPALTEMLYAIGAGPRVVGVSSYDRFPDAVRALPIVGGLLDPDYERIISLRPDLVITYASQTELERRLTLAGIRVFSYRHRDLASVNESLLALGQITGQDADAKREAARLTTRLDDIRRRVASLGRPRTLVSFGRDADNLRRIYVSGGIGFVHDLVSIAGGDNVFSSVRRESLQPSLETLLTSAPAVIVELRASAEPPRAVQERERSAWARLGAIPAVSTNRIHVLYGAYLTIPGPRLGDAAEALARAIHPEAFREPR